MGNIVTVKEKAQKVKGLLEHYRGEVATILPKHLTADRMLTVMYQACTKTPKLLDCTPASLVTALKQASELGLEFNGVLGHAALIPYGNVATFQPMYKGLLDLAYRSGRVTLVQGHVVHENDNFSYAFGLNPTLVHRPAAKDRGDAIGAYVVAHLKGLDPIFHYMPKEEIEAHRDRYSKAWKKADSAWQTAPHAMWLKTVFIQLSRWLPKSIEMTSLEKAIALDHAAETGVPVADDAIDTTVSEITDPLNAMAEEMGVTAGEDDALEALREEVATMSVGLPDDIWDDVINSVQKGATLSDLDRAGLEAVKAKLAEL